MIGVWREQQGWCGGRKGGACRLGRNGGRNGGSERRDVHEHVCVETGLCVCVETRVCVCVSVHMLREAVCVEGEGCVCVCVWRDCRERVGVCVATVVCGCRWKQMYVCRHRCVRVCVYGGESGRIGVDRRTGVCVWRERLQLCVD